MDLRIDTFSPAEWNSLVSTFSDLSLLQTWEYAEATCQTKSLEVSRMTFTEGDSVVGAAQGLIRRIPVLGRGLVWINRGPVWRREGSGDPAQLLEMLAALKKHWVDKHKMYLRVAPTVLAGEIPNASITGGGYTCVGESRGWISGRIGLSGALDVLRSGLRPNWRSSIRKAEAVGVTVQIGSSDALFGQVLAEYRRMLSQKGFETTVTPEFLGRYQSLAPDPHKLLSLTASWEGEALGGILIARYGSTYEYLVGAITDAGKTRNAGQLLLWKAIEHAKAAGYVTFDLGGMDPEGTPPGVLYFKSGVGAQVYELIGEFDACIEGLLSKTIRWRVQRALHGGG